MNVVIIGHIDHGKSTLIGRLLYDSGAIPESRISEMQAMAEEYKRRFEFAYFMDSFVEEIKGEKTVDTSEVVFKGENLHTIIDVPGHLEFIKAMLTGASHAQAAIVVVDITKGIEEQTQRHVRLCRMLGVKYFTVAVNKMDTAGYSENAFNRMQAQFTGLLPDNTKYIPISAMQGDNVYSFSKNTPWYGGDTLVSTIDGLESVETELPMRFIVQGVYDKVALGKVASGRLEAHMDLKFYPSGVCVNVRGIKSFDENAVVPFAGAGECAGLVLTATPKRGDVGIYATEPFVVHKQFRAKCYTVEGKLRTGKLLKLKCATAYVDCCVHSVVGRYNSANGEPLGNGKVVKQSELADLIISCEPLAVERFDSVPALGRITLQDGDNIVAAGIVEGV